MLIDLEVYCYIGLGGVGGGGGEKKKKQALHCCVEHAFVVLQDNHGLFKLENKK